MRNDKTDITVVLDRSGSMGIRQEDAIGGFNGLVKDQQSQAGEAVLSLVQFDDRYEPNYDAKPIRDVEMLNAQTYQPRGSTALLDAIGRTIKATGDRLAAIAEADRPGKVVFVIITDGQENASSQFTRTQINQMISHQRDAYQWTFLFIGTNQDAITEAGAIGIPMTHALNYVNTAGGTQAAYMAASASIGRVRHAVSTSAAVLDASFTKEEREKAAKDRQPHDEA